MLAGSLTEEEVAMSSTAREMVGFVRVIQQAVLRFPDTLKGSAVLVIGDNQGAVAALNKFTSKTLDIASGLKKIFRLCSSWDFDVLAQWRPRKELELEDALSRIPDASDWGLAPTVRSAIFAAFEGPTVDLFASDTWHVAVIFITPHFTSGCAAVDALSIDWRDYITTGGLAWIFPPVRFIRKTLQLIQEFKIDAILIVLAAPSTNWWIDLLDLGRAAKLEGPIILDRSTDICVPSRRVPLGTVNPALFKLRAFKVIW
jgi:hypothetical protein